MNDEAHGTAPKGTRGSMPVQGTTRWVAGSVAVESDSVHAITTASPASVDRPRRLRISSFDSIWTLPPELMRHLGAQRSPISSSSSGNAKVGP